ncbi:MAG: M20/M25/M40 family metallo-hydrolase [Thermoleophilaceae bacterium]
MTAVPARASAQERERMVELFVCLCEIESPSLEERAMADAVAAELRDIGLEVEEDASAPETGSNAGNLLARLPGPPGAPTVLLCAHLDTVPLEGPVEVERRDGVLVNRHDAILGADNKAAVAVILAAVRRVVADGGAPVGLELLFTTCEERALAGAKAVDRAGLDADLGFVFDHASPIGEVVLAAPTYFRIEARFHGRAAHASIRPEHGRSAIAAAAASIDALRLGRLDPETTANVGRIDGGSAANVVPERCRVELEARSLDHHRAGALASEMVDALTAGAGDHECDVDTGVEELFRGYRVTRGSPPVRAAAAALEEQGIEVTPIATGGGSDANVLNAAGLPTVNLANGTERNHEPEEQVTVDALERMLDVCLSILARSADGAGAS